MKISDASPMQHKHVYKWYVREGYYSDKIDARFEGRDTPEEVLYDLYIYNREHSPNFNKNFVKWVLFTNPNAYIVRRLTAIYRGNEDLGAD